MTSTTTSEFIECRECGWYGAIPPVARCSRCGSRYIKPADVEECASCSHYFLAWELKACEECRVYFCVDCLATGQDQKHRCDACALRMMGLDKRGYAG